MQALFRQKQREREQTGGRKLLGREQAALAKAKKTEAAPTKPTTKRPAATVIPQPMDSAAPSAPRASSGSAAESTGPGMPDGFFDTPNKKQKKADPIVPLVASAPKAAQASKPVLPPDFFSGTAAVPKLAVAQVAPTAQGALPVGFFDDKASDAKARGEVHAPPNPEAEWAAFQNSVAGDLQELEKQEDEEEAEAAAERQERQDFEQHERLFLVEQLKSQSQKVTAKKESTENCQIDENKAAAKRKSKRNFHDLDYSDDEDDDDEDIDNLDWRAKAV